MADCSQPAARFASPNCSVCLSALFAATAEDQDRLATTFCGHVYHQRCLEQWLRQRPSCPECREEVYLDDYHSLYFPIEREEANPSEAAAVEVDPVAEQVEELLVKSKTVTPALDAMGADRLRELCVFLLKRNEEDSLRSKHEMDKKVALHADKIRMLTAKIKQRRLVTEREKKERQDANDQDRLELCRERDAALKRVDDLRAAVEGLERDIDMHRQARLPEQRKLAAVEAENVALRLAMAQANAAKGTAAAIESGTGSDAAAREKHRIDQLPDDPHVLRQELGAMQVSVRMYARESSRLKSLVAKAKEERDLAEKAKAKLQKKLRRREQAAAAAGSRGDVAMDLEAAERQRALLVSSVRAGASDVRRTGLVDLSLDALVPAAKRVPALCPAAAQPRSMRAPVARGTSKRARRSFETGSSSPAPQSKPKPSFASLDVPRIEQDTAEFIKHGRNAFGERQAFKMGVDFPKARRR